MNRRAALFAALATAIGVTPAAGADPWRFKRVFRYTPDLRGREGEFREVTWEAVRAGDRVIVIGLDGDRLTASDVFTVKELVPARPDRPAGEVAFVVDDTMNFSNNLHPFYGEKRTDV